MIPDIGAELAEEMEEGGAEPSLGYRMLPEKGRIAGTTDGLDAVRQAAYKILRTERYESAIYSWDYGIELKGLFGRPTSYVLPELERAIREALEADDRIDSVDGFSFEAGGGRVHATFTVHTIFGDIEEEAEVEA